MTTFRLNWLGVKYKSDSAAMIGIVVVCLATTPVDLSPVQGDLALVAAAEGDDVTLPCRALLVNCSATLELLLWYRHKSATPFLVYDGRHTPVTASALAVGDLARDPVTYLTSSGTRYRLISTASITATAACTGHLSVLTVATGDSGRYICTAQYKDRGTRHSAVQLSVHAPPGKPKIVDGEAREVTSLTVHENNTLLLSCLVHGGRPEPQLYWQLNDSNVTGQFVSPTVHNQEDMVSRTLTWPRVGRHMAGASLACLASSSHLVSTSRSALVLHVVTAPLNVTITQSRAAVDYRAPVTLTCSAVGSHPPATVTWLVLNTTSTALPSTVQALADPSVKWRVTGRSDSAELHVSVSRERRDPITAQCTAHNPQLVDSPPVVATHRLIVHYRPRVRLVFSRLSQNRTLREGDDVVLRCDINSRPRATTVLFYHQDRVLTGSTERILITERELVVRSLLYSDSGHYSCTAHNQLGTGRSDTLALNMLYRPRCNQRRAQLVHFVAQRALTVPCAMHANPPLVHFAWTISRYAGETTPLTSHRQTAAGVSQLQLVISSQERAVLVCSGSNQLVTAAAAAATAAHSCVFHLVPARVPDSLKQCRVMNTSAVAIACQPGYSGGLEQSFVLETRSHNGSQLLDRMEAEEPHFRLARPVAAGSNLSLLVYAVNRLGRGPVTTLHIGLTEYSLQRTIYDTESSMSLVIVSMAVAGSSLIGVLVLLLASRVAKSLRLRRHGGLAPKSSAAQHDTATMRHSRHPSQPQQCVSTRDSEQCDQDKTIVEQHTFSPNHQTINSSDHRIKHLTTHNMITSPSHEAGNGSCDKITDSNANRMTMANKYSCNLVATCDLSTQRQLRSTHHQISTMAQSIECHIPDKLDPNEKYHGTYSCVAAQTGFAYEKTVFV